MQQLSLFEEDNVITINDIEQSNFDFFKVNGKLLKVENESEINKYYAIEYGNENPPYYHCIPTFNTITNSNNFKYLIVDDSVMIVYKVIQFMNNNLIKVFDKPISLYKDYDLEKRIVDILLNKTFFKFCFKEKYMDYYKNGEVSLQDCDNYFDRKSIDKKYTPKYIKKNLLHRFESKDFTIEFGSPQKTSFEKVRCLREQWEQKKKSNNEKITTQLNKFMQAISIMEKCKNFVFLNIYYKNELICNYIYYRYNDTLINLYRTTLSRTFENDNDTWLKNTFSRIDKFCVWHSFNQLKDIKYIYYAGASPTNYSLMDYKEKHSSGRITYYVKNAF